MSSQQVFNIIQTFWLLKLQFGLRSCLQCLCFNEINIMFLFLKLIIVINIVPLLFVNCASFENQYLGHHFTLDQYNDLELACDTTICLRDAQLLLLAATQNKTVEPCDDFIEFTNGNFIKFGALNERYKYLGFVNDLILQNWNRLRKVLAAPINADDIKPFKIAKNYFRKCVNSSKRSFFYV